MSQELNTVASQQYPANKNLVDGTSNSARYFFDLFSAVFRLFSHALRGCTLSF
ncbi:hypothetical protein ACC684_28735 [Rhizobium ruizarguesonis]